MKRRKGRKQQKGKVSTGKWLKWVKEKKMSQDDVVYKYEDIVNILEDLFQHSELPKEELWCIFEMIADRYV